MIIRQGFDLLPCPSGQATGIDKPHDIRHGFAIQAGGIGPVYIGADKPPGTVGELVQARGPAWNP